jgi:aspartate-semialdehyde dehydrogenase
VSMQAASGAGYPGVPSRDLIDNVVPYIGGEEEKIASEPNKQLGEFEGGGIRMADLAIDATSNRVALRDGHLEVVSIGFARQPDIDDIVAVLREFKADESITKLPSSPARPIIYRPEADRPQPILDRHAENGMAVSVGRIKPSRLFDVTLTLLVHNTIRGAAGAAILNAELLESQGYLEEK